MLIKVGGKSEDADDIVAKAKAEKGIVSVDDFVKFFRNPAELADFYDGQPTWNKKAPIKTAKALVHLVDPADRENPRSPQESGRPYAKFGLLERPMTPAF